MAQIKELIVKSLPSERKNELIHDIMDMISKVYVSESVVYSNCLKGLEKLSYDQLYCLQVMVMTSITKK
jgi:hypothetical protein